MPEELEFKALVHAPEALPIGSSGASSHEFLSALGRYGAFTADPLAEFVCRFEARTGQLAQLAEP